MKRAIVSLLVSAAIAGAGAGAISLAMRAEAKRAASQETAPVAAKAVGVKVKVLKAATVEDRLVLTGTVDPWEDILVSSEARGRIEWQGVEEGDTVEKGRDLIRIDTSLLQAQLSQTEAQQKLASQELDRAQTLTDKGITTAQMRDKATADFDMSSASLRLIRLQIEKSLVKAPIDGIVDKLFKDENEFTDMGSPLVRIVQVHKVKIRVGIPERDIMYFLPGAAVRVDSDALRGRPFPGVIHKIGTTAEPATLTFIAEIAVDNPEGLLKPGMVARVTLVRREFADSILIPLFSVLSLDNLRFVFVERDGVAYGRPIEVGVLQGDAVQVTQGLAAGDRLIVSGQRDLKDRDPVSVLEVEE